MLRFSNNIAVAVAFLIIDLQSSALSSQEIGEICWARTVATLKYDESTAIQVGHIGWVEPPHSCVPTIDLHVFIRKKSQWNGSSPVFWHAFSQFSVVGHTPELSTRDVDGDGIDEVIFYYHTGSSLLVMEILVVNDIRVKRPDTWIFTSHFNNIRVLDNGCVFTRNGGYGDPVLDQTWCLEDGIFIVRNTTRFNDPDEE